MCVEGGPAVSHLVVVVVGVAIISNSSPAGGWVRGAATAAGWGVCVAVRALELSP